jgi:hypothetical protein
MKKTISLMEHAHTGGYGARIQLMCGHHPDMLAPLTSSRKGPL